MGHHNTLFDRETLKVEVFEHCLSPSSKRVEKHVGVKFEAFG